VTDQKRREVVSQKEKLMADIFREREEPLQILKRMAGKKKQKKQNRIILFSQPSKVLHKLLTQFSPSVIAETGVRNCQPVAQMEEKAVHEQNQTRASGFPFHNFSSSLD